jgi:RNA polymerase sigma factor (sigma-70 family)
LLNDFRFCIAGAEVFRKEARHMSQTVSSISANITCRGLLIYIGEDSSPMPDEQVIVTTRDISDSAVNLADFDLRRSVVQTRLAERVAGGGYAVPDVALVRAIRGFHGRGDTEPRDALFARLIERCKPMFQRYAAGLRHRPELREDAISDMVEQLWKEILDPRERFIEQNFAYYLKCLCVDNFKRVLRAEGYGYRLNDQGQIVGRPEHIPAAMIDRIDRPARSQEDDPVADVIPDATDQIEKRVAAIEVERILETLADPLDRKIVKLRVFAHLKWDEIAQVCNMSERTMRSRFEEARKYLATVVQSGTRNQLPPSPTHLRGGRAGGSGATGRSGPSGATRGRKKGTEHGK